MFANQLADQVLLQPLAEGADELYVIAAYATPNMLSWYLKNIEHKTQVPIKVVLLVGMVPFDHISASIQEGFIDLHEHFESEAVSRVECSYLFDAPAFHGNLYIWRRQGQLFKAFQGSANFVQSAFVGNHRQEVMAECDPHMAWNTYQPLINRSVYCNYGEIEEFVVVIPTHPILDVENNLIGGLGDMPSVELSLVCQNGEPGQHSGLNWGQRKGREPNEAYIPLPRRIAKSDVFPVEHRHFTAITDDRKQLILRVEQQNNKAITTPARNSDLGEYFRNRLGLPNGAPVARADLERYGRLTVVFYKLDDETFYMDFSV